MRNVWQSVRRVRFKRLILLALLLWLWLMFVIAMIVDGYGRVDRAQPADVIVILGAGVQRDNTPGLAMRRRVSHAADLWRAGYAPVVICTGGKPENRSRSEADTCAELLLKEQGLPESAVLLEDQSRSTEENAMFTRKLMQEHGWQSVIISSDNYHVFRARRLFANEGMIVYTSPSAEQAPGGMYVTYLIREVAALQWQLVKEVLNLPITYVQGI
ncbi:MAG: YdcF family protein [Anaerolineaceae bacterium]|nr:YdcF family protein [Anaerolineaceae bacterium]